MKRVLIILCALLAITILMPDAVYASNSTESQLSLVNSIANKHMQMNSSLDMWLADMEANGFKLISTEQANSSFGINSNEDQCIDLPTAHIFEDYNRPGEYVACAWFFWNNDLWKSDLPWPCPYSGRMGGKDSFGISFSRPVNILSKSFQTWDNSGTIRINSKIAENQSAYGVSFSKYDEFNNAGILYYWDSGFISVNFTPQQKGQYVAWQTMGHTWGGTDISSVSIGSSGISINFTASNNRWKAVAPRSASYTFY